MKKKKQTKTYIYAEIIPNSALPAGVPPLKVLVNDSLAGNAVDKIKSSQLTTREASKLLIEDFLNNDQSVMLVSSIIKGILAHKPLHQPTRELVYWSLDFPSTHLALQGIVKANLKSVDRAGHQSVADLCERWLLHPDTRSQLITPLLRWTMEQPAISVQPLAKITAAAIPEWKNETKDAMKDAMLDYLRSDDAKVVLRDSILKYFNKSDPPSSTPVE